MRRFILCILCAMMICAVAFAHSGGTDKNGGHSGGGLGYHYHHGLPAHDHKYGCCPYDDDFDKDVAARINLIRSMFVVGGLCLIIGILGLKLSRSDSSIWPFVLFFISFYSIGAAIFGLLEK